MKDIYKDSNKSDSVPEQGTAICHVRNTRLAAGLIAMGVPTWKLKPHSHVKNKQGREVHTYNFMPSSSDGKYSTTELIAKWKRSVEFIAEENRKEEADPEYTIHPWARIVAALQAYEELLTGQNTSVPLIPFGYMSAQGPVQFLAQEGSKRYKKAIQEGLTQL